MKEIRKTSLECPAGISLNHLDWTSVRCSTEFLRGHDQSVSILLPSFSDPPDDHWMYPIFRMSNNHPVNIPYVSQTYPADIPWEYSF